MLIVVYVLTPFWLCTSSKLYVVHCVWVESSSHSIEELFVSSRLVWPCCFLRPLSLDLPLFCFLCLAFSQPCFSLTLSFSQLLQNAWASTWSCFVLGTGGVISQRSLCWCARVRVSQRIHEGAGSWASCPLCATDYIEFCSSLAHFAVDVGLVLGQARCSALKKIKEVFTRCSKDRPVDYKWMLYHYIKTPFFFFILVYSCIDTKEFTQWSFWCVCLWVAATKFIATSSIFDLSVLPWWGGALI